MWRAKQCIEIAHALNEQPPPLKAEWDFPGIRQVRLVSLGHLCVAFLCHHHQLYRPAGHRRAQPVLIKDLGWNQQNFADVVFAFSAAYAIGYAVGGRIMDWIGVRLGYTMAVILWSLAAMGHALARGVTGFSIARFALGFPREEIFPASHQDRERMVPEKRARAGNWDFQCRQQRGRAW